MSFHPCSTLQDISEFDKRADGQREAVRAQVGHASPCGPVTRKIVGWRGNHQIHTGIRQREGFGFGVEETRSGMG